MKRIRALSDAERALWAQVAATVSPRPRASKSEREALASKTRASLAGASLAVEGVVAKEEPGTPLSLPKPASLAPQPKPPPLAPIERRLKQRLARGQRSVDAKIDLHGMRQEEAHDALLRFVSRAQLKGGGLILVVTGKGGRKGGMADSRAYDRFAFTEPDRGVLHRMVPLWLAEPALRRAVIGFEPAAQIHGGSGALYVRIRKAQ